MDYKSLLGWRMEHEKTNDNLEKYVMEAWAIRNNRGNHTTVYKITTKKANTGNKWPRVAQ